MPHHHPQSSPLLFTNKSQIGCEAYLQELTTSEEWTGQQDEYADILELKAVLNALMAFQDRMMGQDIILLSDNSFVLAYIDSQGLFPDICVCW